MAKILLHGTLHATIFEASGLKASGQRRQRFGKLFKGVQQTSVYATIDFDKVCVAQTRMICNEPVYPRWYESFQIYCAHMAAFVLFSVKVDGPTGVSVVGRACLAVENIIDGEEVDSWLELYDDNQKLVSGSNIHVRLEYFDARRHKNWSRGVRSAKYPGVPDTFFSQREGCKVILYQDAHVSDYFFPKIPLSGGLWYEAHRCWEDIFEAVCNAEFLIYITGWSVYTEITLVRDTRRPRPGGDVTLGELLKRKASEGVRVLMLLWDDKKSVGLLKNDGATDVHCKHTADYFDGSDVHCVLVPREPDDSDRIVRGQQIFTHNQKTIVVDYEDPSKVSCTRRIVSFIGGIDLCDGRYDTQFHSLFRTLDTVHHDDFHQPNLKSASIEMGGPREPWHDIHARLEGPVAWDVLYNFEQRWRKQGGRDVLLHLMDYIEHIIPPSAVMLPEDKETWNIQLFRSIDGASAHGLPDTPEEAARAGLISWKNQIIDTGVQDAYINAIRRAKNFIYIENQYFLGSSSCWRQEDINPEDIGALHLIPKELALKITSKIQAGERFTVYIVVPMWPEGLPDSAYVQAVLDWQRRTMEMMYTDIIQALKASGIEANPKDYLTFFCLGNREVKRSGEYKPVVKPRHGTDYYRARKARRFKINVHSKLMIVDDEYIIVGSANINQRSMDGGRDSEIVMGAFQPYHLSTSQPARGQVHGFRMALWYEHLGMLDDVFLHPESLECVHKVNWIADRYWDMYTSNHLENDLPGHLLSYPVGLTNEGVVAELPGTEFFPDTRARVLGSKSDRLPPVLTT